MPSGTTASEDLEEIRRTVLGISLLSGAPMLLKNTYNSLRIAPLTEAFPGALFLVSHRDPIDAAQSVLAARVRAFENKTRWWSLPPRQFDRVRDLPYHEQVVEQVLLVYEQIERDRAAFGRDRFLSVRYEELCDDPREVASTVESFLKEKGRRVRFRREIPAKFEMSSGLKVSEEDYERIAETVRRRC